MPEAIPEVRKENSCQSRSLFIVFSYILAEIPQMTPGLATIMDKKVPLIRIYRI